MLAEDLFKEHGLEGIVRGPEAFCPISYATRLAPIKKTNSSALLPDFKTMVEESFCIAFWISSRQRAPKMALPEHAELHLGDSHGGDDNAERGDKETSMRPFGMESNTPVKWGEIIA